MTSHVAISARAVETRTRSAAAGGVLARTRLITATVSGTARVASGFYMDTMSSTEDGEISRLAFLLDNDNAHLSWQGGRERSERSPLVAVIAGRAPRKRGRSTTGRPAGSAERLRRDLQSFRSLLRVKDKGQTFFSSRKFFAKSRQFSRQRIWF